MGDSQVFLLKKNVEIEAYWSHEKAWYWFLLAVEAAFQKPKESLVKVIRCWNPSGHRPRFTLYLLALICSATWLAEIQHVQLLKAIYRNPSCWRALGTPTVLIKKLHPRPTSSNSKGLDLRPERCLGSYSGFAEGCLWIPLWNADEGHTVREPL